MELQGYFVVVYLISFVSEGSFWYRHIYTNVLSLVWLQGFNHMGEINQSNQDT